VGAIRHLSCPRVEVTGGIAAGARAETSSRFRAVRLSNLPTTASSKKLKIVQRSDMIGALKEPSIENR
jgi:hypothetical protein